jgi:predicted ribosome quality control (RQC) complex YloA/Tae2 family protein
MATAQGLSGIDVRALVTEWERLLPLWVDKAYEVAPGTFLMRFKGKEHGRYALVIEPPVRAYLTLGEVKVPKTPSAFAMLLRKYLLGGRVLSVRQHGIQRIVIFDIGKSDHLYHLVIELFDRGNIVLCDRDWTIIQPLRRLHFREREIVAGAAYTLPPEGPATGGPEEFARFLAGESRDIVRALAVGAMLGGPYAEYLCRKAGVDKKAEAGKVDAGLLYTELQNLLKRASEGIAPVVTPGSCFPFPLDEGVPAAAMSFNQALDTFFPPPAPPGGEEAIQKEERTRRDDHVRSRQQEAVRKFEEKIAGCERAVEALYSHYPLVHEILEALRKARETHSWQEIEALVRGAKSGPATRIVAVYPERGAVDIDLGERVTLTVGESIEANAAAYYEEIKKYRRKIAGAQAAMERAVPKKERRPARAVTGKKRWYHRFRWFFTSDGVLVVGGRDASQNEELVRKYMEGSDLFVHADVHGASVVIVKGKTGKMDEVAVFAASYSGAWKSGHLAADVYCVDPSQVSKTPESGEYVSRGSFIVRGERRYFRNVPLGIAIGLRREPDVEVIGGPPAAVQAYAPFSVMLVPGRFEPNDAAKKALRALKEKLSPDEQREFKKILTTEAVAAFVPAGGSDIVEAR